MLEWLQRLLGNRDTSTGNPLMLPAYTTKLPRWGFVWAGGVNGKIIEPSNGWMWTSYDGERVYVRSMSLNHLKRTIAMFRKAADRRPEVLDQPVFHALMEEYTKRTRREDS